jgi:hypothetical protein
MILCMYSLCVYVIQFSHTYKCGDFSSKMLKLKVTEATQFNFLREMRVIKLRNKEGKEEGTKDIVSVTFQRILTLEFRHYPHVGT